MMITETTRPRFAARFQVQCIASKGVFLLAEDTYEVVEGEAATRVAALIDGQCTVEEIAARLRGEMPAAEVYYVLMQMERDGYLTTEPATADAAAAAFWDLQGVDPGPAMARIEQGRVAVHGVGLDAAPFLAALEQTGVSVEAPGDLAVVITNDYLHPDLAAWNETAWASGQPWMLVKPVGKEVWVGPLFIPGQTVCGACLVHRLQVNRQAEAFVRRQRGAETVLPTSIGFLPSTVQTAYQLAVTEIVQWMARGWNARLEGRLVSFDTGTLEVAHHVVVGVPQCPVCGDGASEAVPEPLTLRSCRKRFTADGGHRIVPPEVTFKTYKHHLSRLTGIVRELKPMKTGASHGLIHSYSAWHTMGAHAETAQALRYQERHPSAGKGMTARQAQTSGLCEALERYSGIFQNNEPRIVATYRGLGREAVHPQTLLHFSAAQYENRQGWNAAHPHYYTRVPEPFEEDREIAWTPVWSLTEETFRYVPTAYCYYSYPRAENPFCEADSNGNAGGNTREEALLQGFLELVERDAVAIWWYNRLKRPRVDLASFDEPYIVALQAYYRALHRDLWVLDVTSDLGIPTFVAVSPRTDRTPQDILLGFGSHFDARIAVLRALTEINQLLPSVLHETGNGSARYGGLDALAVTWNTTATLENQPHLVPDDTVAARVAAAYPSTWSDDLLDDVHRCVALARHHGLEVLVLDQTRPEVAFNVVKVIVPGLRHFWKRLGPGRLYEVPGKMGWLGGSLEEQAMNPFPLFL